MVLLFIFATVALAALGLAAYVCWWLWRKSPYGRIAAAAIPAFVIYHCIIAVFPPVAFYREEFADRTGIAMPPSANIKFKKASFPDFHGDYASELLFEVSKADFAWLRKTIDVNPRTDDEWIGGMYRSEAEAAYGKAIVPILVGALRLRDTDERGSWALLNDGKTVYFWFVQT